MAKTILLGFCHLQNTFRQLLRSVILSKYNRDTETFYPTECLGLRVTVDIFFLRDVLSLTLMMSLVDYMKNSIITHEGKDIKEVIYPTRERHVFHRDNQTPKRELKVRRVADYFFDEIRGI